MNGWIKLHRKIIKWEWYSDANTFRVFVHLLITANRKPGKWLGNVIDRGQLITGRKQLSHDLGLTDRQIRTALEHLKSTNDIAIHPTNKFSLVTIVNYELYQAKDGGNDQQDDQPPTNHRPANDHKQEYKKDKKKDKCTPKSFYESELKASGNDPKYQKVIGWLFGENLYDRELKHVLAMKEQLSYKGFLKMIEIQNDYNVKTKEILEEMDAWLSKNPKSKNSTVLGTFRTFAKRAKK